MNYRDGYDAWHTEHPLEYYDEMGIVNEYFLDGWMDAKFADPENKDEHAAIWGDQHDTEAQAETTVDGPATQAGMVAGRLYDS